MRRYKMEKALEILKDLKKSYMQNREASSVLGVAYIYANEENKTNEAITELEECQKNRREWYQKGYNEAMKPKTCEGCKYKPNDGECYYEPCGTCARFFYDHYSQKE